MKSTSTATSATMTPDPTSEQLAAEQKLHCGDVVKLKSSDQRMTVLGPLCNGRQMLKHHGGQPMFDCAWHDGQGHLQNGQFPQDALERA
jgi:uncharacterized protein YodC (DUF2158 family)